MNNMKLTREGEGRYTVHLAQLRAGLVLGGHGKWIAEDAAGATLGHYPTRKEAAKALADDVGDPVWKSMMEASNATGLPRHYRSDLQVDRSEVRRWAGSTDFLWMLRENGTSLLPLSVDWARDDFRYRLELYGRENQEMKLFLVCAQSNPGNIQQITPEKARKLLDGNARFAINNAQRCVVEQPSGRVLASLEVSGMVFGSRPDAVVNVRLVNRVSEGDYPALMDSAFRWLCHYAGTFFAAPKAVRLLLGDDVVAQYPGAHGGEQSLCA